MEMVLKSGPGSELVTCLECGAQFRVIGSSHLKKHGMTIEQYRAKRPGAPLYPPGFLEQKGLAISKGWAKPGLKAREGKKRRARYHDPVLGKNTRDALQQGRTNPEVLAKKKSTMQRKAETDPNTSARMRKISREYWNNLTPKERARETQKRKEANSTPERIQQQSEAATRTWAKRNAEIERLRTLESDTEQRQRIILATCRLIQGVSKGAMSHELYPQQNVKSIAKDNTKKFFRPDRYGPQVEAEKHRLLALPEAQRDARAAHALDFLKRL
jgi:hypothetical protein